MTILFFFFNDTATTEIYTLSLHDALPIFLPFIHPSTHPPTTHSSIHVSTCPPIYPCIHASMHPCIQDRKSTRLNSSHANISYAVFCLKKKKNCKPPNSRGADGPVKQVHMT